MKCCLLLRRRPRIDRSNVGCVGAAWFVYLSYLFIFTYVTLCLAGLGSYVWCSLTFLRGLMCVLILQRLEPPSVAGTPIYPTTSGV